MIFRARSYEFIFPRPALIMGIINVTPDSFSDGGNFLDTDKVVAHGLRLVKEGAEILDMGGESTRPGAEQISEAEELKRVIPVIKQLATMVSVPISIDTVKPSVARAALTAGASIVNDVGANRNDDEMWRIVADAGAGYICMHMQGSPQTMQANPVYTNVIEEVENFFRDRLERLKRCSITGDQVIFDPGIGFGKTLEHNLRLIANLGKFTGIGRPLLIGISRKSFIGKLLGTDVAERLPASISSTCKAVEEGANIVRTHDVAPTIQAVRMFEALTARER